MLPTTDWDKEGDEYLSALILSIFVRLGKVKTCSFFFRLKSIEDHVDLISRGEVIETSFR